MPFTKKKYSNRYSPRANASTGAGFGVWFAMLFTMVVASTLSVYPLGEFFAGTRPLFMFMVLVFWVIHRPDVFGIWFAFFVGIVSDFLLDTGLAQQAFSAALATAVLQYVTRNSHNLNELSVWFLAALAIIVFSLSLLVLQHLSGQVVLWHNGLPMLTSILLWPLLTFLLKRFY